MYLNSQSKIIGDELDYDVPDGADDVKVYVYGDKLAEKGDIIEAVPYLAVIIWDEDKQQECLIGIYFLNAKVNAFIYL